MVFFRRIINFIKSFFQKPSSDFPLSYDVIKGSKIPLSLQGEWVIHYPTLSKRRFLVTDKNNQEINLAELTQKICNSFFSEITNKEGKFAQIIPPFMKRFSSKFPDLLFQDHLYTLENGMILGFFLSEYFLEAGYKADIASKKLSNEEIELILKGIEENRNFLSKTLNDLADKQITLVKEIKNKDVTN